jgi:2-polyprenyl-6-methoxyphenol hydroxylase-like FAD-dependent oxidoreductase
MRPQVLIIGCGFGGLEAARAFAGSSAADVDITVVDKTTIFSNPCSIRSPRPACRRRPSRRPSGICSGASAT